MKVELIDSMGHDNRTVDAARVSFNKLAQNYTPEQNSKLIKYLESNDHWTPAAHIQVTCRVKIPIFIARQWFKHQIGSVKNEISRRYVDYAPEFYFPEWRSRPSQGIKQGSGDLLSKKEAEAATRIYTYAMQVAADTYDKLLKMNVAPEQARSVLPLSLMTEFYDTGSLTYWGRIYKQRTHPGAQQEWANLCKQIDKIMSQVAPITWKEITSDR